MQKSLSEKTDLPPLILDLLKNRGYTTAKELEAFLNPSYERHLHDPFLLTDMKAAVKRILAAVERREKIVVYGDYDIDGITASIVMLETIAGLGGQASSYIPDRFEEGYGINLAALKQLKSEGTDLVISVDCGVTSVDEIAWANQNSLDIVITDHHAVPEVIPAALAVVNPKRSGDKYPFKELAGVGVAFKLAQALQRTVHSDQYQETELAKGFKDGQEKWLLDVVALGTVCDVVPLVGENRVLVKYGLRVLRQTRRVGLQALAAAAGIDYRQLTAYHLGFGLGPRLNAAGRLEHAARSLELLRLNDKSLAGVIAGELNDLNIQRQAAQATILAEANIQAEAYKDEPVLVLADAGWSHGVVGIVASKLVEKWRKPTLVAQVLGSKIKGSGRSTGQYDLVAGMRAVSQHFERFGGHYFAAGFTLPTNLLPALRRDLNQHFRSLNLPTTQTSLKQSDLSLPDLSIFDDEFYESLQELEPYGHGNPRPVLEAPLTVRSVSVVGKDGSHLRLVLNDSKGNQFSAIGFGLAEDNAQLKTGDKIKAVFQLSKNKYQGITNLQLVIVDLKRE